jgi:GT2 family glycosyltransferase
MLETLSGFDEDFFLVYEDADLNMRARLQGFRCLYVPDAIVRHMVNTSIGKLSHTYVFFGHRNSEYLFWKNMPTQLLWRFLAERMIFNLLSMLYFTLKGRGFSFLKAKVDFLGNLSEILKKRAEVQKRRNIDNQQFRALLDRNWLRYRRKVAVQP